MKKLAFTMLLLFIPFSSGYPADPPPKLAFLFAVPQSNCPEGYDCGSGQGAFETFLLVIDGDQMKIALRTPHLYVPRKSGFWEIGILPPKILGARDRDGGNSPTWWDWRLWAAPAGQKPVLASPAEEEKSEDAENSEFGGGIRYFSLSWVGNDYLAFTDYFETSGASLAYVTAPMILPIDDLGNTGYLESGSVKAWTPPITPEQRERDLARCVSEDEEDATYSRDSLESATQGWLISRGRMRWVFEWSFNHGSGAARGYNAACATSLRPPRPLVGADTLKLGWNQILPRVPDAQTAFSSPDGSLLLVFTRRQILAFRPAEGALSKPFATLSYEQHPILMAQWAVGKFADNWAEQLAQAKSWTEISPAVSAERRH
jgi:hypothetical protein